MTRIESTNTSLQGNSTDNATTTFLYEESEEVKQVLDYIKFTRIIVPIVFGLITITGIVGNTLTIAVVLRNKDIRSITNILITSLAVADLLFIVFCVPFQAIRIAMFEWTFGEVWCRISNYFTYTCGYASMYMLVLISLDRYFALVHPIRALTLRTKRNCYITLTVIWSIILLGNMPMIFQSEYCSGLDNISQSSVQMFHICFFVFGFMLPIILMCVLYLHIMKIFLTGNNPGMNNQTGRVRSQAKQRVTKMVVTVALVFIICWLPFHIFSLSGAFENYFGNIFVFISLYLAAMSMSYVNSCINPMLYTFYSKTFRKGFKDLISCKNRNYLLEDGTAVTLQ